MIVDDHAPFRSIAGQILTANGFVVVGEAADGAAALRVCHELHPDIVMLDVQLPDLDGFAVAAQVSDGPSLLHRVAEDPPEVCVVDIRMPSTHTTEGLDTARRLRGVIRASASSCSLPTSNRSSPWP